MLTLYMVGVVLTWVVLALMERSQGIRRRGTRFILSLFWFAAVPFMLLAWLIFED